MMVQEIIFHIGDCKTGTTSIQTTLAKGLFSAPGHSYLYPCQLNHIPLADTLRGPENPTLRHERWSKVANRILGSAQQTAFISAETFEFIQPDLLARTIDQHFSGFSGQIRFISYIRPHAERFVADFSEKSKQGRYFGGLDLEFKASFGPRRLRYLPRLSRWRDVFGPAYEVHPMIRSRLTDGDAVTDFLRRAFRTDAVTVDKGGAVNESLSLADMLVIRRLHQTLRDSTAYTDEIARALGWNFAALLSTLPKPTTTEKPRLYKSLAQDIHATYRSDAAAIDATFFPEDRPMLPALERSVDLAPAEPQSMAIEDYFPADALRIIDGFALLLRRLIEADPKHFRTSVRPEDLRGPRAKAKLAERALGAVMTHLRGAK